MIPLAWRVGAAVGVLLFACAGIAVYGHTRYQAGREAAEADWAAATREAADRFASALADQQQALERTETALQRSRAQTSQRQEKLSDAVRRDPASADWASGRIPDAVRVSLGAGDTDLPGNQ